MNWCWTCKKEMPNEAMCNVHPICESCQIKELQAECAKLEEKLESSIRSHVDECARNQSNIADLKGKLLASEAAGVQKDGALRFARSLICDARAEVAARTNANAEPGCSSMQWVISADVRKAIDDALSTTHGQSFLDERERHVKALGQIRDWAVRNWNTELEDIAREALNETK